jgi:uncharacterized protein (TIGR02001 family)
MNWSRLKYGSLGAASLLAASVFAGPALADGLSGSGRIASKPRCALSGNIAATTDYVFRGISQNQEDPAVQATLDATCGNFYVGFFGSNVDFADGETTLESTVYAGYKTAYGGIGLDFGLIYYAYAGGDSDLNFLEFKAAATGDIWKGGSLTGAVYYTPEIPIDSGPAWTLEGTFAQTLPNVGIFSPVFSATLGAVYTDDFDGDYTYWNVGVSAAFLGPWSLDLRYWDTDGEGLAFMNGTLADERFVATLKYSF